MSFKTTMKYSKNHLAVVSFDDIQFIWPKPFESSRPGKGGKENMSRYAGFVVGNVMIVSLNFAVPRPELYE